MIEKPSKLQPALLGGLVLGLGSVIPGLHYGNFCCCGWGLVGGALMDPERCAERWGRTYKRS
jgi:hypothetical protein